MTSTRAPILTASMIAAFALAILGGASQSVSARKLECTNAASTFEMNRCADDLLHDADARLNATYKMALRAVPEMAGDAPYDAKSWERSLRASQRAWLAYRDAECKNHSAMFWTGGTGATVDILGCMTTKTKERTEELKGRYQDDER